MNFTGGGILVLVSPYSWLQEYTEKKRWLGGKANEPTCKYVSSWDAVQTLLMPDFVLMER